MHCGQNLGPSVRGEGIAFTAAGTAQGGECPPAGDAVSNPSLARGPGGHGWGRLSGGPRDLGDCGLSRHCDAPKHGDPTPASLRGGRQRPTMPGIVSSDVKPLSVVNGPHVAYVACRVDSGDSHSPVGAAATGREFMKEERDGGCGGAAGPRQSCQGGRKAAGSWAPIVPPLLPHRWLRLPHRTVSDPKSAQFSGAGTCLAPCHCCEGPRALGPGVTPASLSAPSRPCLAGLRPFLGPSVCDGHRFPRPGWRFLAKSAAFPR